MRFEQVDYPIKTPEMDPELMDFIKRYSCLAAELGMGEEAKRLVDETEAFLRDRIARFAAMCEQPPEDPEEPEALEAIRALRPDGPRRLCDGIPADYDTRLQGALLGRGAGCTLGAALEFEEPELCRRWAAHYGDAFPLRDYYSAVRKPGGGRYIIGSFDQLVKHGMDCVPVDDDTNYTVLGLLALEEKGRDFTVSDMAQVWQRHLTEHQVNGSWQTYWGERICVANLNAGVPAGEAGFRGNPNVENVAAWTRADPWGYAAPGWPEKAAELAFRDASLNHRRNGVYASMFFAATIAAAFCVDEPIEAIRIGLTEIPKDCLFAQAVRWALENGDSFADYEEAYKAVRERYEGMFKGSAINCGLFVVLGIMRGGRDFTVSIGDTVSMGYDNDCTGATAGSIVGAVVGKGGIPKHWYEDFNDRWQLSLLDCPNYISVPELAARFRAQAMEVRS